MKLHLPKSLRAAVLACLAVAGGFATTIGTGFVAGGALTFAFAVVPQAQATEAFITTYGGEDYVIPSSLTPFISANPDDTELKEFEPLSDGTVVTRTKVNGKVGYWGAPTEWKNATALDAMYNEIGLELTNAEVTGLKAQGAWGGNGNTDMELNLGTRYVEGQEIVLYAFASNHVENTSQNFSITGLQEGATITSATAGSAGFDNSVSKYQDLTLYRVSGKLTADGLDTLILKNGAAKNGWSAIAYTAKQYWVGTEGVWSSNAGWGVASDSTTGSMFYNGMIACFADNSSAKTIEVAPETLVASMEVSGGSYKFTNSQNLSVAGSLNVNTDATAEFVGGLAATTVNVKNGGVLKLDGGEVGGYYASTAFNLESGSKLVVTGVMASFTGITVGAGATLQIEAGSAEGLPMVYMGNSTLAGSVTNAGSLTLTGSLTLSSTIINTGTVSEFDLTSIDLTNLALKESGKEATYTLVEGGTISLNDFFATALAADDISTYLVGIDATKDWQYAEGKLFYEMPSSTLEMTTGDTLDWSVGAGINTESFTNGDSVIFNTGADVTATLMEDITAGSITVKEATNLILVENTHTLTCTNGYTTEGTGRVTITGANGEGLLSYSGMNGCGLPTISDISGTTVTMDDGSTPASITVLSGTTLKPAAAASLGVNYDKDRDRAITIQKDAALDVACVVDTYYHVVLEEGAVLKNTGGAVKINNWAYLPKVTLTGDAEINSGEGLGMRAFSNPTGAAHVPEIVLGGKTLTLKGTGGFSMWGGNVGTGKIDIAEGSLNFIGGGVDLTSTQFTAGTTLDMTAASATDLQGSIGANGAVNISAGNLNLTGALTLTSAITNAGTVDLSRVTKLDLTNMTPSEDGAFTLVSGGNITGAVDLSTVELVHGKEAPSGTELLWNYQNGVVSYTAALKYESSEPLAWANGQAFDEHVFTDGAHVIFVENLSDVTATLGENITAGSITVKDATNLILVENGNTLTCSNGYTTEGTGRVTITGASGENGENVHNLLSYSGLEAAALPNLAENGVTVTVDDKGNTSATVTMNDNTFTGITTVLSGTTLKQNGDNTLGAENVAQVHVNDKGVLDINHGQTKYHVFLNEGATLTNTGSGYSEGEICIQYLTLNGDAIVDSKNNLGMLGPGYNQSTLSLQGNTLTKVGTARFHLLNTTVDAGTIAVKEGTLEFYYNSGGSGIHGVDLTNTRIKAGYTAAAAEDGSTSESWAKDVVVNATGLDGVITSDGDITVKAGTMELSGAEDVTAISLGNVTLADNNTRLTFSGAGNEFTLASFNSTNTGYNDNANSSVTIDEQVKVSMNSFSNSWGLGTLTVNGTLNVEGKFAMGSGGHANDVVGTGSIVVGSFETSNIGTYNISVDEFTVTDSATLNRVTYVKGGTFTLGGTISGNGQLIVDGGTVKIDETATNPVVTPDNGDPYTAILNTVDVQAGALMISADNFIIGTIKAQAGDITVDGKNCTVNSLLDMSSGSSYTGKVTVSEGGSLKMNSSAQLKMGNQTNAYIELKKGGTLNYQDLVSIVGLEGNGSIKAAGDSQYGLGNGNFTLTNAGVTVMAATGDVTFANKMEGGTLSSAGATLTGVNLNETTLNGAISIGSGTLTKATVAADSTVSLSGVSVNGSIANNGTLSLGGDITVTDITSTTSEIAGRYSANTHGYLMTSTDYVVVTGTAATAATDTIWTVNGDAVADGNWHWKDGTILQVGTGFGTEYHVTTGAVVTYDSTKDDFNAENTGLGRAELITMEGGTLTLATGLAGDTEITGIAGEDGVYAANDGGILELGENVILASSRVKDGTELNVTLSGTGTYDLGSDNFDLKGATLGENWQGTVNIAGNVTVKAEVANGHVHAAAGTSVTDLTVAEGNLTSDGALTVGSLEVFEADNVLVKGALKLNAGGKLSLGAGGVLSANLDASQGGEINYDPAVGSYLFIQSADGSNALNNIKLGGTKDKPLVLKCTAAEGEEGTAEGEEGTAAAANITLKGATITGRIDNSAANLQLTGCAYLDTHAMGDLLKTSYDYFSDSTGKTASKTSNGYAATTIEGQIFTNAAILQQPENPYDEDSTFVWYYAEDGAVAIWSNKNTNEKQTLVGEVSTVYTAGDKEHDVEYDGGAIFTDATGLALNGGNIVLKADLSDKIKEGAGIYALEDGGITIESGVTLEQEYVDPRHGAMVTLAGAGTYDLGESVALKSGVSLADATETETSWTGTVTTTADAMTATQLAALGNAGSTVKLTAEGGVTLTCDGVPVDTNLEVTGLTTTGALTVGGNLTAGAEGKGRVTAGGSLSVGKDLTAGEVGSNEHLSVTGNLTADSVTTMGSLTVGKDLTAGTVYSMEALNVSGNLDAGAEGTVGSFGDMAVTGNLTAGSVTTMGSLTVDGNLDAGAEGAVTAGGALTVKGSLTTAALSVGAASEVGGSLDTDKITFTTLSVLEVATLVGPADKALDIVIDSTVLDAWDGKEPLTLITTEAAYTGDITFNGATYKEVDMAYASGGRLYTLAWDGNSLNLDWEHFGYIWNGTEEESWTAAKADEWLNSTEPGSVAPPEDAIFADRGSEVVTIKDTVTPDDVVINPTADKEYTFTGGTIEATGGLMVQTGSLVMHHMTATFKGASSIAEGATLTIGDGHDTTGATLFAAREGTVDTKVTFDDGLINNGELVIIDCGAAEVTAGGMQNSGTTEVSGSLAVTGGLANTGGSISVADGGSVTTDTLTSTGADSSISLSGADSTLTVKGLLSMTDGSLTTEDGAGVEANQLTGTDSTISVGGSMNVTDAIDLTGGSLSVTDGGSVEALALKATDADIIAGGNGITVKSLTGDAASELSGLVTVKDSVDWKGTYDSATIATDGAVIALQAADGLSVAGSSGTITIDHDADNNTMDAINTTGAVVELRGTPEHTLTLTEASTMQGGTLKLTVDVADLGKELIAGNLTLDGTTVSIGETGPVGGSLTLDVTDGNIAGLSAMNATDVTVELTGALLQKYFENARVEDGMVVADRNDSYVSEKIAASSENGKAGAALLDDALVYINPQVNGAPDSDLATLLNAVDNGAVTDEDLAAVAGASVATVGMALSGDVERQLQAIRNRTTTMGVNECVYNEDMPYFNAWMNAEGNRAELDRDGTAAGYVLDSWGGTVGFDVDCNDNFSMGLAITAMYGDLESDGPDRLSGDMDTYYVSLFARYASCAWTHTFVGTIGKMDGNYTRTVNAAGTSYDAEADTEGTSFGLMYEVGYVMPLDDEASACLQPIFNVMLRHSTVDSYTEDGSDAALAVDEQTMTSLTFGLGARLQAVVGENLYNRFSVFEGRVLAKVDVADRSCEADVALPGAGKGSTVESAELGAFGVEIGAGLNIPLDADAGTIFIDASAEFRSGYTNVNGTVGYRINF